MRESPTSCILIVEREPGVRGLGVAVATSLGLECTEAPSAATALATVKERVPDIVLTGLPLPDLSGEELVRRIRACSRAEVIILTDGSTDAALEAMRLGACDYLPKPFTWGQMQLVLQRTTEKIRLLAENEYLRDVVASEQQWKPTHLGELERATIARVLQEVKGDKALAGRLLGISRATLYRKLKRYHIGGQRAHAVQGVRA
jgi:DNA-binding NtrC family response regulator